MAGVALKSLALNHFRSYKRGIFNFSPNGSILFGQNGSGKTNMLEAMSLFSPGKGLRKSKIVKFRVSQRNWDGKLLEYLKV